MGTRSLTVFVETWEDPKTKKRQERELAVMYRQMDGYPTGHGDELKEFLKDMHVVNGLSSGQPKKIANGMGCLACQVIGHFKKEPGHFYLDAAGTRDCGEEYIYTLRNTENGHINLQVRSGCVTFFGMPGTKEENMGLVYDGDIRKFSPKRVEKISRDVRDKAPNDFLNKQRKGRRKVTA